ncbi:MKI67 FHA domain-interacting nucleolar phosphoprotein, partial [Sigmodon hispidus]
RLPVSEGSDAKEGRETQAWSNLFGSPTITFTEKHIYDYFTQFGTISRFRLSRSKRTGKSKGYGFVEFQCVNVVKIVAETMDNYLFGERLLMCKFMPPEK